MSLIARVLFVLFIIVLTALHAQYHDLAHTLRIIQTLDRAQTSDFSGSFISFFFCALGLGLFVEPSFSCTRCGHNVYIL